MKILKKMFLYLWLLFTAFVGTISIVHATWWSADINAYSTNLFNDIGTNNTNIWISTIWTNSDQWWSLIQVIKNVINWVLGMLALIALVLCLWWWFQIVTAAWDEWKQKKWLSVLKHAAVWLVVIWLSWFVVTIIFRLLRGVTWVQWQTPESATVPSSPTE